ncbi:mcfF, partial [Symbiodinium necroappetens]
APSPEEPLDSGDICDRFEQWEEWDASTPLWKHAAAGSCAGVMEHIGMYPLDTVKTHMQALRPGGARTLSSVIQTI